MVQSSLACRLLWALFRSRFALQLSVRKAAAVAAATASAMSQILLCVLDADPLMPSADFLRSALCRGQVSFVWAAAG